MRVCVPGDLQELCRKVEIRRSLRTNSLEAAVESVGPQVNQVKALFQAIRGIVGNCDMTEKDRRTVKKLIDTRIKTVLESDERLRRSQARRSTDDIEAEIQKLNAEIDHYKGQLAQNDKQYLNTNAFFELYFDKDDAPALSSKDAETELSRALFKADLVVAKVKLARAMGDYDKRITTREKIYLKTEQQWYLPLTRKRERVWSAATST